MIVDLELTGAEFAFNDDYVDQQIHKIDATGGPILLTINKEGKLLCQADESQSCKHIKLVMSHAGTRSKIEQLQSIAESRAFSDLVKGESSTPGEHP